jgi:hypothetical protein
VSETQPNPREFIFTSIINLVGGWVGARGVGWGGVPKIECRLGRIEKKTATVMLGKKRIK